MNAVSLQFAASTDIGCKRANNEDSFGYDLARQLYVVCDGMGGMAAGEVASNTAVRALVESFARQSEETSAATVEARLYQAICHANASVRELAEQDPRLRGMGTTLVCACMDGPRVVIGNVGDSRAYFVRGSSCSQITHDHSLVGEQVRQGIITQDAAASSSLQSIILRAIGAAETVEPDFFAAAVEPSDMILLSSDGLSRYVSEQEIAGVMSSGGDLPSICQELIDRAKQAGGADNITCLVLRMTPSLQDLG